MEAPQFELADLPMPMVYATYRTIRDCNAVFAAQFGYMVDELRDASFNTLYPDVSDFIRTGNIWQRNMAGGNAYYDERIMLHRDGSQFWCRVHGRSQNLDDPFASAVYCFEKFARPVATQHELTSRQLQIVTLVAQGKTSATIAKELSLSPRTVEAHRARLMKVLGLTNTADLVAWFLSAHPKS